MNLTYLTLNLDKIGLYIIIDKLPHKALCFKMCLEMVSTYSVFLQ